MIVLKALEADHKNRQIKFAEDLIDMFCDVYKYLEGKQEKHHA
jgi:hypothetical protein